MNGRQRRIGHRGELDVVVAHRGDVVRHAQAAPAEPVDEAYREEVVGTEDRRRRQRGEELVGCCETGCCVHRLDLDLDQVAVRVEPGVGQRCDEADAPVLALRDRQRPVDERDSAVAQPQKMLAREPAAEDVVDDGGRDVARRAAMVEEHERDAAVGQPLEIALVLTGRIDDDPADTLTRDRVERAQKPEKPPPSERHT